ncbi:hypothetical protein ZOSMA_5726G00010, partial [Zostera marina]
TLCRVKGSYLESLFSGHCECQRMFDGAYYIDRCGEHFSYVLDYLRHGTDVSLPKNALDRKELELEANYYGLKELAEMVGTPNVSIDAFLSPETLQIQKNEQEIRATIYNGTYDSSRKYQGLVRLFVGGHRNTPIQHQPGSLKDTVRILLTPKQCPRVGPFNTVSTVETFRACFNRFHGNVLSRLEPILCEEPLIIAGGSVLAALRGFNAVSNDVDLFVCTTDHREATRIARRVWLALALDNEHWVILRRNGVINMHLFVPPSGDVVEKVQVVLRLYESPAEVIYGFDCDCCACAYDGRDVYVTPRCYRSLETMTIILNPIHSRPNTPSYELRLAKYAQRGFNIGVPGFDAKRVDMAMLLGTKVSKMRGLGRLVCLAVGRMQMGDVSEHPLGVAFGVLLPDASGEDRENVQEMYESMLEYGATPCYEDDAFMEFVPDVYCGEEPETYCWMDDDAECFPGAMESRDSAWQQIENGGDDVPPLIPPNLSDAWSSWERSREYLNHLTNYDDLNTIYYLGAYGVEQEA